MKLPPGPPLSRSRTKEKPDRELMEKTGYNREGLEETRAWLRHRRSPAKLPEE